MKRESDAAKNVVLRLIYTGVNGQVHAGDTFGIWTYNDDLHARSFPMQTWIIEDRESISARASDFLKQQKFTGGAHLEKALLPMLSLVTNSPNLTVILVSDGKQPVVGTPFDKDIRALHKKYYDELKEAKLPFVTVLVAHKGKFIDFAVNSALGPIRVPALPKPPPVTNQVAKAQTAVATNQPVRRPEPLILRGPLPKKTNTTQVVTNAPETVVPRPPLQRDATSNVVASAAPATSQALGTTNQSPVAAIPQPTNGTTTAAATIIQQTNAPVVTQSTTTMITNKVTTTNAKEVVATSAVPVNPIPVKEQTSNVASFQVQQTNLQRPEPVASNTPAIEQTQPAQTAVVTAPESSGTLRNVLIAIGVILTLILIVLVMMLRKSKAGSSLITQSLNKPDDR